MCRYPMLTLLFCCCLQSVTAQEVQTIPLKHAKAETVASILSDMFPTKFSANSDTNTIYARVPESQEEEVKELVEKLEEEAEAHNVNESYARRDKRWRSTGGLGGQSGAETEFEDEHRFESRLERSDRRFPRRLRGDGIPVPPVPPLPGIGDVQEIIRTEVETLSKELMPLINEITSMAQDPTADSDLRERIERLQAVIERGRHMIVEEIDTESMKRRVRHRARAKQVESEIEALLSQQDDVSSDQQEEIRAQVNEHVGKLFDIRLEGDREELERAQQRLDKIRKRLDEREEQRDEIIRRRVEELLAGDV